MCSTWCDNTPTCQQLRARPLAIGGHHQFEINASPNAFLAAYLAADAMAGPHVCVAAATLTGLTAYSNKSAQHHILGQNKLGACGGTAP
jgi:hypothetical protein